jgi:hypothetical protein
LVSGLALGFTLASHRGCRHNDDCDAIPSREYQLRTENGPWTDVTEATAMAVDRDLVIAYETIDGSRWEARYTVHHE